MSILMTRDEAIAAKMLFRTNDNRSWWVGKYGSNLLRILHLLPFDLTPGGDCGHVLTDNTSVHATRWHCTRNFCHTGRHAAGDGHIILAVW